MNGIVTLDNRPLVWLDVPMTEPVLVRWRCLPLAEFINIFKDAQPLPAASDDIGPGKTLFWFKDAAGNTAFAVASGDGTDSFGSVLLRPEQARAVNQKSQ